MEKGRRFVVALIVGLMVGQGLIVGIVPVGVMAEVNHAPVITTEDIVIAYPDTLYYNDYDATDPDEDVLTWDVQTDAGWLSMNPETGELSGTPGPADIGEYSVNVSVSDDMLWDGPYGAVPTSNWPRDSYYDTYSWFSNCRNVVAYDNYNSIVIFFGGQSGDETWEYNPATREWAGPFVPEPRPAACRGWDMTFDPSIGKAVLVGQETWTYDAMTHIWSKTYDSTFTYGSPSIAYDSHAGRVIMFGGWCEYCIMSRAYYEYDSSANNWYGPFFGESVFRRSHSSMVYDSTHQKSVMFGGSDILIAMGDTWEYDSTTHTSAYYESAYLTKPAYMHDQAMTYDSHQNKVVLFGGADESSNAWPVNIDDVWLYDAGSHEWSGPYAPNPRPPKMHSHKIVYDPVSEKVLLFGRAENNGYIPVWEYSVSSNTWTGPELPEIGSTEEAQLSAVYDSVNERVVFFGRNGIMSDETWEYDPTTRERLGPYMPNPRPSARKNHAIAYDPVNNRVVLFGGETASGLSDETWEYDTATHTWYGPYTPATRPSARDGHLMSFDGLWEVVLFGGETAGGLSDETWVYDASAHTWFDYTGFGPPAMRDSELVYDPINFIAVLFGGETSSGLNDEIWEYAGFGTWNGPYTPATRPSARAKHAMAYDSVKNRMILYGGWDGAYDDETWEYDSGSRIWYGPYNGPGPSARSGHAMVFNPINGTTALFGGYNGSCLNDIWEYPNTKTPMQDWHVFSLSVAYNHPPTITTEDVTTAIIDRPHSVDYEAMDPENDPFTWSMETNASWLSLDSISGVLSGTPTSAEQGWYWTNVSVWDRYIESGWYGPYIPNPAPSGRSEHTLVYDSANSRMVMFGGYDVGMDDEVWEYDPLADTWSGPYLPSPRPSARYAHAMAYDPNNNRTIMFGGYDGGRDDETWEYDSTTHTWSGPYMPATRPSARRGSSMVYDPTINRTVLFSGTTTTGYSSEIWEYDAATHTWSGPFTPATRPAGRQYFAMTYDSLNSRIVIFGGETSSGYSDETWEYDASTRTWYGPYTPAVRPPAMYRTAMASDDNGSIMLFGGDDGGYSKAIWIYTVANHTWVKTYTLGTGPSARRNHAMVYVPESKNITLFGGYDGVWNNDIWKISEITFKGRAGDYHNFTLTVSYNQPPSITTTNLTMAMEDSFYVVDYEADDSEGDTLTWSLWTDADFLALDPLTGILSGTPNNSDVGSWTVNVTADDGYGLTDWQNFTITVANRAPEILTEDVDTASEGIAYSNDYDSSDDGQGTITWSLATNATWLSLDVGTGLLSGTPDTYGWHWINVTVDDGNGGNDWQNFTLHVNGRPTIITTDVTDATEDIPYSVGYNATDPNYDALTWSLWSDSDFLSINSITGLLSGSPDNSDVGTWTVNVTVIDGNGGTDWHSFTLTIANAPPSIVTTDVTIATEDVPYSVDYVSSDDGQGAITWNLWTDADFLGIDPTTGILSGTPDNTDVATWDVNVSVSDGNGGTDWHNFTLMVSNVPPNILTTDVTTSAENSIYSVDYDSDDDGQGTIAWILDTNATWLSINAGTGLLSGTPVKGDAGWSWVNVTVNDGNGDIDWHNFTLMVSGRPEIITSDVINATEDTLYSVDYDASDPEGDPLLWSVSTNATWLSIDPFTGELTGMPINTDVGEPWVNVTVKENNEVELSWDGPYTLAQPPLPSKRKSHSMAYDSANGRVVLFGGYDINYNDQTWEYEPTTNTWYGPFMPANRPSARSGHTMVYDSQNNRVVLFGGQDGSTWNDETWEYETSIHTWYGPFKPINRPSVRADHAMVYDSYNHMVAIYGGYSIVGVTEMIHEDLWTYSASTHTWEGPTTFSYQCPGGRAHHTMAYDSVAKRVVLFGGFDEEHSYPEETWELNAYSYTSWDGPYISTLTPDGFPSNQAMVYDPSVDKVVLFGPRRFPSPHYTWEYDTYDNVWLKYEPAQQPSEREEQAMVYDSSRNKMILFGGTEGWYGDEGILHNDVWEYFSPTHTWTKIDHLTESPPAANAGAIAYDSGNEKNILFGGYSDNGPDDETWEYNAATHTWSGPYNSASQPSPRYDHAMAYDSLNDVTVLFGGYDGSNLKGETFKYDGTTHTWNGPYLPATSPSPRRGHRMVFDSSNNRIILFGGKDSSGYNNETWEYDAATHTWSGPYISITQPSARCWYTMTYDSISNRAILFGGESDLGYNNETWEYDAAAHTWDGPYFSVAQPSAMVGMEMVYDWLNSKTVLFGGSDGEYSNETWMYDSVKHTWSGPHTPAESPSARGSHHMTYDSANDIIVLFGGHDGIRLADTWELSLTGGLTDYHNFTLFIANNPPEILTENNGTAYVNWSYYYDYESDDDGQGDILWTLETNASWLSIQSDTGILSGMALEPDVGNYWVNVTVEDGNGGTDFSNVTLSVLHNSAPVIATSDVLDVAEDALYFVDYSADDAENNTLLWSLWTDADFLTLNESTITLSGTPDNTDVGAWTVNVTVDDGFGGLDWHNFTLTVTNTPPTIITEDVNKITVSVYYYNDYDSDDDGQGTITWSVATNASCLSFNSMSAILYGGLFSKDEDYYWINITIDDGNGGMDFHNFTLTVHTYLPPTITTSDNISAIADEPYSVDYNATDPNNDTLTWSLATNASWLSIDPVSGVLSGTPDNPDVGDYWVNVSVKGSYLDPIWHGPDSFQSPSERRYHTMAYDSKNDRTVLFGGNTGLGAWSYETWEYDATNSTWDGPYTSAPRPSGRYWHAMAYSSDSGRIVLFGGYIDLARSDETWEYDVGTHTWYGPYMPATRPPPLIKMDMAYDSINKRVVLFGGYGDSGYSDETWEYDSINHTWSGPYTPATRPSARYGHSMVYDSSVNRVVLFGGWDGGTNNDVWEYDASVHMWYGPYVSSGPSGRYYTSMTYDFSISRIVLFSGSGIYDDTWEYSALSHSWSGPYYPSTRPSKRFGHTIAYDSVNRLMVLFGGDDGADLLGNTWRYNSTSRTWIRYHNSPSPRSDAIMVYDSINNMAVLFGGDTGIKNDETWEYNVIDGNWSGVYLPSSRPSSRDGHAMAYDTNNNRVILFGGNDGDYDSETWEYNTATHSWSEDYLDPRPAGRWGHSMAFDPVVSRTILFGGLTSGGLNNETWEYDAAINAWYGPYTSITSPPAMQGQKMVYDINNGRIILFGGETSGGYSNETWEYDATTQTWHGPFLSSILPSARHRHAMTFNIDLGRTIIFGGETGEGTCNDIWEYDSYTHKWHQLLIDPNHFARKSHELVYSPLTKQMILFGGTDGITLFNDIWKVFTYNDGTDFHNFTLTVHPEGSKFLAPGLNHISLTLLPTDTSLTTALASIAGQYDKVTVYDASDPGDRWKEWTPYKSAWMVDLTDIDHTMGIIIDITGPEGAVFTPTGTAPTDENNNIDIYTGWNFVGFPSLTDKDRDTGLNNLTIGVEVAGVYRYDDGVDDWVEMTASDMFKVGESYWVYALTDCLWDVPL